MAYAGDGHTAVTIRKDRIWANFYSFRRGKGPKFPIISHFAFPEENVVSRVYKPHNRGGQFLLQRSRLISG